MPTSTSAVLLLADGRLPDGGHAHSHGLEHAVDAGRVTDVASLGAYVTCRLWTTGRTDAATARLAAGGVHPDELDAAWCLRTPSAAARATSRSLGSALARAGARLVPDRAIGLSDRRPAVQPVAFGLLAAAIGCDPDQAAHASAHGTAATLAAAGLRLLSLDPFDVAALLLHLRRDIDAVVGSTCELRTAAEIPHATSPLAEIDVELQRSLPARLFRS